MKRPCALMCKNMTTVPVRREVSKSSSLVLGTLKGNMCLKYWRKDGLARQKEEQAFQIEAGKNTGKA